MLEIVHLLLSINRTLIVVLLMWGTMRQNEQYRKMLLFIKILSNCSRGSVWEKHQTQYTHEKINKME